jgi:signal transduction histidine kinase
MSDTPPVSNTLAPLLVKWLTHDLATPIATVMTASELLGDTADAEINDLVSAGAQRLGARLRLIRAALAPGDAPIGGSAFRKLIAQGIPESPLTWNVLADAGDLRAALIAGVAMLMADVRRGQPLTIAPDSVRWEIDGGQGGGGQGGGGQGDAVFPSAVAAALSGAPATDSRSAIAEMLVATAARAGVTLTILPDGLAWH